MGERDSFVDYTHSYGWYPIIGIAGIIASGKTTLCKNLSAALGWDMIPEPVKTNPYLPLFYKEIYERSEYEKEHGSKPPYGGHYSFAMQVFLLNERYKQHQAMIWNCHPAVQDRTIYEDPIFALMLRKSGDLSELDFDTYAKLFQNMLNFLHRPDLIIYLDVEPEKAHERLMKRGRECEKGVPVEYLRNLRQGYEDWLATDIRGIPILRVDWNDPGSIEEIINLIEKKLKRSIRNTSTTTTHC